MSSFHTLIAASLNSFPNTTIAHSWAFKSGAIKDVYFANNILNGYIRWHKLHLAHKLFDEMTHRDTISWNTMITGNVNHGNLETALETMKGMNRSGFELDGHTFGSALKGIALARRWEVGQALHSMAIKWGLSGDVYTESALLDMYSKCDRVEEALSVFDEMPERNTVSWNSLISCCVRGRDRCTAFRLLSRMKSEDGLGIDDGTAGPLLTLLDGAEFLCATAQVHCTVSKAGLVSDPKVCNAMITSYSECGSVVEAERVFRDCSAPRDIVTWNSMIGAYLAHRKESSAFGLFSNMQRLGFEPDIYTYTSIVSACFEKSHKGNGRSLHGLVIKRGLGSSAPVSNSLMAMYLKSNDGSMEEALSLFDSMEVRDRVSWNSILTGLSQSESSEEALRFFVEMRRCEAVDVDHYTFSAALRSCADLATFRLGQQVHASTLKSGLDTNEFVTASMIFMYSKCGIIGDATRSFEESPKESSVTWNSMIFAYAQHGQGFHALKIFSHMIERCVKRDHITFVAVLTACSHAGLVGEGLRVLKSMESDHGTSPRPEHYACAVDLLGRAGRLNEAQSLVMSMPFGPNPTVLKTLLGACRACGDIELASEIANHLLIVEPKEHCTYVLLSDMYGHLGRWDERARVKKLMRERGVRKVPGWSWIEIEDGVRAFKAEDRSKPDCDRIYFVLDVLMEEIRRLDDLDELQVLMDDFGALCDF